MRRRPPLQLGSLNLRQTTVIRAPLVEQCGLRSGAESSMLMCSHLERIMSATQSASEISAYCGSYRATMSASIQKNFIPPLGNVGT